MTDNKHSGHSGIVVHGPCACGKTRNSEALARAYGLTKIVDGWKDGDQVKADTLYLTHGPLPDAFRDIQVVPFDVAIERVPVAERVAPAPGVKSA